MFAATLAAALALPVAAQQTQPEKESVGERARRAMGQPQPQPAPAQPPAAQQGQAPAPPAQGHAPLTDEQRAALSPVWARNTLAIQAGDMAASRGASPEVQSLGRRLASEHRRAGTELSQFVSLRGGDVNALAASPERQRIEGELGQLSSKSGEEFDRDFVAFLTRNDTAFVEDLKRLRDVTPGKDAVFKKWLDQYENDEEGHLAAARQLKSQRQARTPPAR